MFLGNCCFNQRLSNAVIHFVRQSIRQAVNNSFCSKIFIFDHWLENEKSPQTTLQFGHSSPLKSVSCLNLPGHCGQSLQMASPLRAQCWYYPSTFPERSSRVCPSHKNPPSHYLCISPVGGRGAVRRKWNDISGLVNSRSIMTVLLGFTLE